MGAVCCVARDATTSAGANGEIFQRTIQYSPPWAVRWDNRGRVAGEETPASVVVESVHQNNRLAISRGKFEPNSQKSLLIIENSAAQSKVHISGSPGAQKITMEVEGTIDMPAAVDRTTLSTEPNIPSASYLSVFPSPSKIELASDSSAAFKWSPSIPKSHLFGQESGSQLCRAKSHRNSSASEGRLALLPVTRTEITLGCHDGSLDSWSVQRFPESPTSTRKDTRSFDNELFGSHSHKLAQSHSRKSKSLSNELKTCVVCSKYLLERSSFSSQKIVPNNELSVVAILVCGHVYHADCLEHLTPEISKYDPPCPICTFGEQKAMNMFEKLLKEVIEKKPKKHCSRVLNSQIIPLSRGSCPTLESSSSLRNSFTRPFLKRHFSFGSMASSSLSETQHPTKLGLWTQIGRRIAKVSASHQWLPKAGIWLSLVKRHLYV